MFIGIRNSKESTITVDWSKWIITYARYASAINSYKSVFDSHISIKFVAYFIA